MAESLTKSPRPDSTPPCALKAKGSLLHANKPPPASRHRAALLLRQDVPLFDMRVCTSVHPEDIMFSSRNTRPTMMVETISTNRVSVVQDSRYLELMVTFYPRAVNFKNPSKLSYKLIMPKEWTPRMYLGALNQSIRNNAVLSL
jgi:hypothetical protein